ncbi:MAG: hypothetical protein RMK89_10150 [Armatimonadota bacterium]|nr:hypothetical protein [Armatimonadota bacterium]MDW8143810.1 hypothetical protein [Armatimonadota bacterium]
MKSNRWGFNVTETIYNERLFIHNLSRLQSKKGGMKRQRERLTTKQRDGWGN